MMAPVPEFDLYETLGLEKTASAQEIKESFRRLALIHHPDKNPGDDQATARFQRIGLAHETLSNPTLRQRYDDRSDFSSSDESDFEDDLDSEDLSYKDINYFLRRTFGFGRARNYEEYERRAAAYEAAQAAAQSAAYEAQKAWMKEFMAEKQRRCEEEEAARQALAAAKKAEEEEKIKEKEARERKERDLQEIRWSSLNATTVAEKQRTCLHSEFWPKEQQKPKFKCGICGKKAGMMAYKCPHCSTRSCQQCRSKLRPKRTTS